MLRRCQRLLGLATCAALVFHPAPAAAAPLLAGSVLTASGPIEGVLVRATDVRSGSAVSVFSRANGSYAFPDGTLNPGAVRVDIRAAGFELGAPIEIELRGGTSRKLPIRLVPAADPSAQWNNAEWITAAPPSDGAVDQRFVLNMCTHCHSIERVLKFDRGEAELIATISRMSLYAVSSVPERPVLRPDAQQQAQGAGGHDELALLFKGSVASDLAHYLGRINPSPGRETPALVPKALPLPRGDATRVVIRSWVLPRKVSMPHDVVVDARGIVWYDDFGVAVLGRLDPATGAIKEYPLPILRPDVPEGSLDIRVARDGAIWIAMLYQGAVARFDPQTEKFQTWSVPRENSPGVVQIPQLAMDHADVDGRFWVDDASIAGIHRIDMRTGAVETFKPFEHAPPAKGTGFNHTPYGIASDSHNNLFFLDWGESQVGRIDARTGAITYLQTPSAPSRPRRGNMDEHDRYWFAEWQGNAIGRLDTKTGRIREWRLPTPNSAPYDAVSDAFGNAWSAGMATDRVQRVSIATGKVTEYLLPARNVNVRRVFVQNTKSGPVFWIGDNLSGTIYAVRPLH